ESRFGNFLVAGVTETMLEALSQLGIEWFLDGTTLTVTGTGLKPWRASDTPIDCRNSGMTIRTLAGALAATNTPAVLDGSDGLRRRPMGRVVEPLAAMGADIETAAGGYAPIRIGENKTGGLKGLEIDLPVASAQVKTALLLAGLGGLAPTIIHEPGPSRDHTERIFAQMGIDLDVQPGVVRLNPPEQPLTPLRFTIPGDVSSAAFLIVAALITPNSEIRLQGVGLNPTRTGLIDALLSMGADIEILSGEPRAGEPVGDLIVRSSKLKAAVIKGDIVVRMIDEFPVFAVAAVHAEGSTVVQDAEELRYKETDRIQVLVEEFCKLGVQIEAQDDGFTIQGGLPYQGGEVSARGDHRLGMALAVLSLGAESPVTLSDAEIIAESFPGFVDQLKHLGAEIKSV
ncbi:MAG: 3-phosphoshikimate 1-carboxyvinyltransferase, partial [Chloroflexota bacterium]